MNMINEPNIVITAKKYLVFLFSIFILFNLFACKQSELTQTNNMNLPWIAPGKRTVERQKNYFRYFSDTISTTELYWGTEELVGKNVDEYIKKIAIFFKKNKLSDRWVETNSYIDGQNQKLAPFSFHIVAIEPLVLILVPKENRPVTSKSSVVDLVGWPCDNCFTVKWMVNYIEYGNEIPFNDVIFWFSPEIDNKLIKEVLDKNNKITIARDSIKLDLVKTKDVFIVSRTSVRE